MSYVSQGGWEEAENNQWSKKDTEDTDVMVTVKDVF